MSTKINSNRFLKYVKNTIEDLEIQGVDFQQLKGLRDIYKSKELKLTNVSDLYEVIYIRKQNYEYIKSFQDKYSFDLINNEHRFMEQYLDKNFKYEVILNDGDRLFASVSLKEKDEWCF